MVKPLTNVYILDVAHYREIANSRDVVIGEIEGSLFLGWRGNESTIFKFKVQSQLKGEFYDK